MANISATKLMVVMDYIEELIGQDAGLKLLNQVRIMKRLVSAYPVEIVQDGRFPEAIIARTTEHGAWMPVLSEVHREAYEWYLLDRQELLVDGFESVCMKLTRQGMYLYEFVSTGRLSEDVILVQE